MGVSVHTFFVFSQENSWFNSPFFTPAMMLGGGGGGGGGWGWGVGVGVGGGGGWGGGCGWGWGVGGGVGGGGGGGGVGGGGGGGGVGGGYIGFTMSVCLDSENRVRSVLNGLFPYLAQMITSIRGPVAYNDIWPWPISSRSFGEHEVCRMWWPLTLTFIFKVIRPWLRKLCPLCSVYSFGRLFLCLAQMITIIRKCVACYVFFHNREIWIFGKFCGLDLEKISTVLDGLFQYLAQMVISMRWCVGYNDLWPWPIFSRSFGIGLENRVRYVASTVLDGFFPYLV